MVPMANQHTDLCNRDVNNLPTVQEAIRFAVEDFLLSARSVLGRRLGMAASIATKSVVCTTAAIISCVDC
jgi:hypothetical protein